ncbi:MAG: helix-turn-helix transcriptional regulator [Bacteroidales bacterium]|nr:helix-turn-helix transcriptional regulator [Bacteroidales bacterium]
MNKRLQQFLSAENISQAQFADTIGVARASVSHILAGRNKPGFDFMERMSKRYPALSLEWLITGKGKMYKGDAPEPVQPVQVLDLWQDAPVAQENSPILEEPKPEPPAKIESITSSKKEQHIVKQRSISRIVVFYDDNTFQELK